MNVIETGIKGLLVIEPKAFHDERGFFMETYQRDRYVKAGIDAEFCQDNHSRSTKGVVRGMHFTLRAPQAQFLCVYSGEIFDVAVDLRDGSPTFGHWHGTYLNVDTPRQVYLPPGFAHGYCVISDTADVLYKVTHAYDPSDEGGLNWRDPDIGIDWPVENALIKDRDDNLPNLCDLDRKQLPQVSW